jgi:hypothetical protein
MVFSWLFVFVPFLDLFVQWRHQPPRPARPSAARDEQRGNAGKTPGAHRKWFTDAIGANRERLRKKPERLEKIAA